jgi:beta-glucosidase
MLKLTWGALALTCSTIVLAAGSANDPDARAAATLKQMSAAERTVLTHGIMALPFGPKFELPDDAIFGAGYVPGLPRLSVPSLKETDASLGVAYVSGLRKDGATALPSGLALAATWNPEMARAGGAMIASEAHGKGFNVLLAGGVNLLREPRNGRNFEYLGEDPWLAGTLDGAAIAGIQSQHVLSTIKHFALNDQETARHFGDVKISEAAARESDLLAFQIAIERGQPGAVMCAYNQVGGHYACDNDYLLNQVLKRDWAYKGFVMSDWGAVPGVGAAQNGLDQQSGAQLDGQVWFDQPLTDAATADRNVAARVSDMNRRILRSIYAVGLDTYPPVKKAIDFAVNAAVAEQEARQAIVLLRNARDLLPLRADLKRIAVIGGYADSGVLSGGGSSQVQGEDGPAVAVPLTGEGVFVSFMSQTYHRSSPLKAIRTRAPQTEVTYRDGRYISDAVIAAKNADVAIVFATQWMGEGFDAADLSLPQGQDALIAAVAAANPRTIVVLETGGPVLMPWLEQTSAVLEAWYPGARGGEAIASVLFGDTNPSGHLPVTFPASLSQLTHPQLPGADEVEPNFIGTGKPGQTLTIDYDVEGSDIGYRWFAREKHRPLFPFGFGLSYTHFESAALTLNDGRTLTATLSMRNSGTRAGDTVAQLYLVSAAGVPLRRLVGYARLSLAPGQTRSATVEIDPRLLARWDSSLWSIAAGRYEFTLGQSADDPGPTGSVELKARRFR